ncbi:MAG: hypothetical protein NC401_06530 [Ruminococcus sp.]|nr:hypothetical protein [Ruminococcus sp.]
MNDKCVTCRFNTNHPVCHPHCSGCDGKSKYEPVKLKIYNTIAVDFDGTLCENNFPEIGEPKDIVIDYIKRQAAAGAHIILYTCRENGTERNLLDEALQFCTEQGIELYAVNENPDNTLSEKYGSYGGRKVFADIYIDDKAMNVDHLEAAMEKILQVERGERDNGKETD